MFCSAFYRRAASTNGTVKSLGGREERKENDESSWSTVLSLLQIDLFAVNESTLHSPHILNKSLVEVRRMSSLSYLKAAILDTRAFLEYLHDFLGNQVLYTFTFDVMTF